VVEIEDLLFCCCRKEERISVFLEKGCAKKKGGFEALSVEVLLTMRGGWAHMMQRCLERGGESYHFLKYRLGGSIENI